MLHRTIKRPRPNRRPPPATRSAAIRPRSIASRRPGNVRIATETQTVYGDHAVYDVDRTLLVVTGKNLKLETPRDTLTARDSLEWYDDKQLAVARGDAVAIREGKRLRGDVLTAAVVKPPNEASHISRVDAQGNVLVSSQDQIARGDAGVYNVDTGIATLDRTGHAHPRRQRAAGAVCGGRSQQQCQPPLERAAKHRTSPKASRRACRGCWCRGPSRRHPHNDGGDAVTPEAGDPRTRRTAARHRQSRPRRRQSRQELPQAPGAARRQCRRSARRGGRAARPQRRRQDHVLLHHHRSDRARFRHHQPRRPGHHRSADVPPRPSRHRLSAAGSVDLPRPDRRAEHPRRARGRRARCRGARGASIDELLAEFSITHLRRAPALALSGGERRRVEIARALATQPHFILLDEPLAGIDPIAVSDIRDLVAHLKDRGIGVLITDHNVRETLDIVDRAYILHEGRVLMEGTPAGDRLRRRCAPGLSRREI